MATSIKDNRKPLEPLERRPEARAFKIEDLVSELQRGRIRIPTFQRGINWKRADAEKLFDSLYRGYPVGTLLFWESKAEPAEVRFGSVRIDAAGRTDALWVVDGQQRLVSLARVLLAPGPDKDEFALFFDLDSREFISQPKNLTDDPSRWLPMTEVLDSERLMQWAFSHFQQNRERREEAFSLGRRIREYEIPAYLVRTEREEILREVFGRTNSTGKRLKQTEVFDALHGARGQSSPGTLGQIVGILERLDFGLVEEKLLYRLLRVLLDLDVIERADDGPLRLSNAESLAAYHETARIAGHVINFLKKDAGIPHYELLPYKQPFVLLGKFFKHHPHPKQRSRDLLSRWIWRGALNGAHRGDTVSTQGNIERIVSDDEDVSVQRLLLMVNQRPPELPDPADYFNFRHAASKLQTLALLDIKPRVVETGSMIDIELLTAKNERGIAMPSVVVRSHASLTTSISNRLLHPRISRLKQRLLQVSDPAILRSHGISDRAIAALRTGDTEKFLQERAIFLRDHFGRFFERHARWGEMDRPPLTALMVADEDA